MDWIKRQARFEQAASQAAFLDYVHEVEHATDRLQRVEKAIDDAIAAAPAEIQQVVQAFKSCVGWARSSPSASSLKWDRCRASAVTPLEELCRHGLQ
jgi:hypothetical protein